tara:strand:- start:803 stop:1252 length:450 start_codon:yes stop_codon:yes gene_type:complete
MDNKKTKLQESIRNSLAKQGSDFLVPFISSIVNILTSHELSSIEVKKRLKELKIRNIRTKDGQIESHSRVLDFRVYILYVGVKNYIFKVEGLEHYNGFSFMETNKGIIVHDNVADDPKLLAKELKNLFIKNYKSPYPVSDVFLNFINTQ